METSLSSLENTTVGTTTEFTVTTRGETDLGTTVYGCFTVNSSEPNLGSDGDMTIEYYETAELGQGWHELPSNYFGPEEGFPFNAVSNPMESRFKVTFHKPGSYEIVVLIKEKDGDEVVCQTASFTVNVTEEEPEEPVSSRARRSCVPPLRKAVPWSWRRRGHRAHLPADHLQCCYHQGGYQCQDPGGGHHAFLRGQHCDCVGSQGQL